MTTPPSVPLLIAAHAGRLRLAAATRLLRPAEANQRTSRLAALAGCHHASLHTNTPFLFGWARPQRRGPITIMTTSPVTGAGLVYPPGADGHLLDVHQAAELLTGTPAWTRMHLRHDSLITSTESHQAPALDEVLLDVWSEPFSWLVYAVPLKGGELEELAAQAAEAERDARSRTGSPGYDVAAERARARHRELRGAFTTGAWRIDLLAGAADTTSAAALAGILATAIDLTGQGYVITPGGLVPGLDAAINDEGAASVTGTALLAALASPPNGEIPGVRISVRSTFAVTPPAVDGGLQLGEVIDRSGYPAGSLLLSADSLVRHTFICGATGSGKTSTIQHLLTQASAAGLPWLVIEPTKSEYRHRLDAAVLRIGHPDASAVGINPLQPAPGFALRTHADMLKALLVGIFRSDEPFPQILTAAIDATYRDTGWDLALSQPVHPHTNPRWPTLTDLIVAAQRIVRSAGYGPEVEANVSGFIKVRLGSLTKGTAATFLTARTQLDVERLLHIKAVIELDEIGDDTDKAVIMGVMLTRLTQQLRQRHRDQTGAASLRHLTVIEEAHRLLRRPDHPGPAATAAEAFADMLAEIRAYGEGLIIAEQVPGKLIGDAITNTAIKIMHRLPGRSDRDAVGAAINLSDAQSQYLVGLAPGVAAVATDGMHQPVLVGIAPPPVVGAQAASTALPAALATKPIPTVSAVAHANALAHAKPLLAVWVDLTVLAHLLALAHPQPKPEFATWIEGQDPDVLRLAIDELAWTSVAARTTATVAEINPAGMHTHIVADLIAQIEHRTGCEDLPYMRWVSAYRYNPVRQALRQLIDENADAGRHPDSDAWEGMYGHPIPGNTAAEQEAAVEAIAARTEAAVVDKTRLLHGEPDVLSAFVGYPSGDPRYGTALGPLLEELVIPGGWASRYLGARHE